MAIAETPLAVDPATHRDPIAALTQHVIAARKDVAALKAIVATQAHLEEMEGRINERLDGIDLRLAKMDGRFDAILDWIAKQ